MAITIGSVTFDSTNPRELAAWWAEAIGGKVVMDMEGFYVAVAQADGRDPSLGFQLVDDPTPGKNRLHLDMSSTDRAADTERLVALGGKHVFDGEAPGGIVWTTLADPEGNLFCLSDPH